MTLTIDLTPEESARLEQEANARGVDVPAVLRDLIEQIPNRRPLPQKTTRKELSATQKEQTDYSHLQGYGKYAHLNLSSEAYALEKQEEIAREHGE